MNIQILDTNQGKPGVLCDGYRYRQAYTAKNGDISWRCSSAKCKARMRTDCEKTVVIELKPEHNHEAAERRNERDKISDVSIVIRSIWLCTRYCSVSSIDRLCLLIIKC